MFGDQVATDGHTFYPRAIRETMGSDVQHRTTTYLNNRLEQDHRGMKQRYYPMSGFEPLKRRHVSVVTRDELRTYFRLHYTMGEPISLPEQRRVFLQRRAALKAFMQPAS